MCSVIEISSNNEYYIHYHSPESLDTVWSVDEEDSQDYHPLFARAKSPDLSMDKMSLTITDNEEENDVLIEEIISDSLVETKEISDDFSDKYEIVREVINTNPIVETDFIDKNKLNFLSEAAEILSFGEEAVNVDAATDKEDSIKTESAQATNDDNEVLVHGNSIKKLKNVEEDETVKYDTISPERRMDNLIKGLLS